jgi:DNA-binding CsgD family transcriptional regulator
MQIVFIYALHDPRSGELRYVGASANPQHRLTLHLCPSQRARSGEQGAWMTELVRQNLKPSISIIEKSDCSNWRIRERFWIAHYRTGGARLTNTHKGGEGGARTTGQKWSEERRAHISEMFKGHSVSEKVREAARGTVRKATAARTTNFDDAQLRKLYVKQQLSSRQIAVILGIGPKPVLRRLRELGIVRSMVEAAKCRQWPSEPNLKAAKLSPNDVREIRHLIAQHVPYRTIAARYNINKWSVSNIKRSKTWGWLD